MTRAKKESGELRTAVIAVFSVLAATSIPMGYSTAYLLNKFFVSYLVLILGLAVYLFVNREAALAALRDRRDRPLLAAVAALLAWMLLASLTSPLGSGKALSVGMWFKTLLLPALLGLCALIEIREDSAGFLESLRKGMLASGGVFFFFGFLEFLFPGPVRERVLSEVRWPESIDQNYGLFAGLSFMPIAGLFAHYNLFGVSQAIGAVLALPASMRRPSFAWRRVWVGIFILGIVISTSKSALLALAGGSSVAWFVRRKEPVKPLKVAGIFLAVFGAGLLIASLNPQARSRFQPMLDGGVSGADGVRHLMNGRFAIYRKSIEIMRLYPVKGIGVFQTNNYLGANTFPPKPIHNHNLLLEYGVTGGLVGVALLLVFVYVAAFRKGARMPSPIPEALAAFLFSQVFELFVAHELWYASLMFVLLFSAHASRQESKAKG